MLCHYHFSSFGAYMPSEGELGCNRHNPEHPLGLVQVSCVSSDCHKRAIHLQHLESAPPMPPWNLNKNKLCWLILVNAGLRGRAEGCRREVFGCKDCAVGRTVSGWPESRQQGWDPGCVLDPSPVPSQPVAFHGCLDLCHQNQWCRSLGLLQCYLWKGKRFPLPQGIVAAALNLCWIQCRPSGPSIPAQERIALDMSYPNSNLSLPSKILITSMFLLLSWKGFTGFSVTPMQRFYRIVLVQ